MVTKLSNKERTARISPYLLEKIQKFRQMNKVNKSLYPSDKNFIDRAVIDLLKKEGVDLE